MHMLFLLLRRSAAFLYDCLLLIAVFFVVTTALVLINDGENVSHPLFYLMLWVIGGVFFDGFWRYGGQTLGMRAWHLRLIAFDTKNSTSKSSDEGVSIRASHTWKRYVVGSALFAIGYLWVLFDRDALTAFDRLSRTKIIKDSKHLRKPS